MAGLAQYSQFFQNPLFSSTIRDIPVKPTFIAQRFLPREETFETKFYESAVVRQADMANIVSGLADIPLTDRDPMKHISGEVADIAQGYLVTKEELGALMDKGNAERRKIAETQLLNKARQIRENIDARIEWMGWQALSEGQLTYAKDGIYLTVDFGLDVTNVKTAGVRWDDLTPTILDDYQVWVQDYVDKNGVLPDTFVTSLRTLRIVQNDPLVRKQITGESERLITLNELNTFLIGRQLPKMEAFDTSVTYRDVNNQGVRSSQRLLASNKGVFLKEGGEIGVQLMGPTIENNMNPGIFAETIDLKLPTRSVINVVASSFPKIQNPGLIMPATILT